MADKMIYVLDNVPVAKGSATVQIVTTSDLAAMLADGWEVVSQVEGKEIPWHPRPKKPILGERTILRRREENRGLSVGDERAGAGSVTLRDDYGRSRQVSASEALGEGMRQLALSLQEQAKGVGHLGSPGRHDIPGVTVISAEIVAKAFDVGMQAGIAGVDKSLNPFPPGSEAHTIWLRGYHQGTKMPSQAPGDGELAKAYQDGQQVARLFGPEDEVSCPYRGRLKTEWERGYREAGGTFIPLGG